MRLAITVLRVSLLCACIVACTKATHDPVEPQVIRLTTGLPGAFFNPLGRFLAEEYSRLIPGYTFAIVPSGGGLHNLQMLQRGATDLGLSFADVTYLAFVGRLEEDPIPFDRLRGIAVLPQTAVHVLVRQGLPIKSIDQLRGRLVALGPNGSATAESAKVLLKAFGLSVADVRGEYLPFFEAANQVLQGRIDAAFISAGYPVESVLAATKGGVELLEVSGPVVERLRAEYPFFRATAIPSGAYPTLNRRINTVGIDTVIVCQESLDDALVYQLTKAFFRSLPALALRLDTLRRMDLARAPATPIPLHDGAAQYYRERELLR